MNRKTIIAAAALLVVPLSSAIASAGDDPRTIAGVEKPYETHSFDPDTDDMAAIDAALASARQSGKRVLLVMGTNGCHDSAWFANLIASDRFAPVRDRYEIVFADIGMPHIKGMGRGSAVPGRFDFKIKGTPTIAVLDADGRVLNRKKAGKWRNAASRSDDAIFDELMQFGAPNG